MVEVPSHQARVVALRNNTGVPQFLGWNRQITMGAALLEAVEWNEQARELRLRTPVSAPTAKAPFTYEIAFYVPDGYVQSGVDIAGATVENVQVSEDGNLLRVRFAPTANGDIELVVSF